MDSLTHLCSGALVGELFLGRKYGKKGMLLGAVASSLPDIDAVANLFYDPATATVLHRGITHSLFFAVVASAALSWLFTRNFRKHDIGFKQGMQFFLAALLLHDLLDITNCYGTGLFEPFTKMRITWNILFVADPLFSLPFIVATIALLVIRKDSPGRVRVARRAMVIGAGYILLATSFKLHAHHKAGHALVSQELKFDKYITTPAPLNIFLWHVVAKSDRGCYAGYISLFDKGDSVSFSYAPRNELVLILFKKDRKIDRLKWLADGYYCFTRYDSKIYFNDMRFGRVAGWMRDSSRFVFSYNIAQHDAGVSVIRRTGFDMPASEAFAGLLRRIKGIHEGESDPQEE